MRNQLRESQSRFLRKTARMATVVGLLMSGLSARGHAQQSITEFADAVTRFESDAKELYRFDEESRNAVWDAYCGKLDPVNDDASTRFATEVGLTLQQKEHDRIDPLLSRVQSLIETADKFRDSAETKDKAEDLLQTLQRQYDILHRLSDGLILRGSNHPFVQAAIEYGKRKHRDMCDSYGTQPKVCDQPYSELNGRRPDLVYVGGSGLFIFEFKPEGAKDAGEQQVRDYLDGVTKHYQKFFPNGRAGGIVGSASDAVGGEDFLKALLKEPGAWSSDGMTLRRADFKVETYSACDKPS